ncbi:MAG TPA: hypothetical protein VIA62_16505 [Thermoanaerobaculia bacterium]|jgi:hypothetical protein|nr:hypothetical protein [Thermoanaerobaculia bacterium]
MNFKSLLLYAASAVVPTLALAAPPSTPAAAAPGKPAEGAFHRVALAAGEGKTLPYTLEVPMGWEPRQVAGIPGLWIGPADAKPPEDPRLIWVRGTLVSFADPDKLAATIRANDAADPKWSAPRVELKDLGGVRGLLVQMDTGEGDKARSSLILKLPLDKVSLDITASANRAEFAKQSSLYERILLSTRPAAPAAATKK